MNKHYKAIVRKGYTLSIVRQRYSYFYLYLLRNGQRIEKVSFYSRGLVSPLYEKLPNATETTSLSTAMEKLKQLIH